MADHEDNVYPSAITSEVFLSMEGGPEGVELMIYSDYEATDGDEDATYSVITLDRGEVINLIYDLEQALEDR